MAHKQFDKKFEGEEKEKGFPKAECEGYKKYC